MPPSVITLNVGGKTFLTSRQTIEREPDSMLARLCLGDLGSHKVDGGVFIDRNPELFSYILDWLRDGPSRRLPSSRLSCDQLLNEARFYQIETLSAVLELKVGKLDAAGCNMDPGDLELSKLRKRLPQPYPALQALLSTAQGTAPIQSAALPDERKLPPAAVDAHMRFGNEVGPGDSRIEPTHGKVAMLLEHICKVGQVREMLGAIERYATPAKAAQLPKTLASLPGAPSLERAEVSAEEAQLTLLVLRDLRPQLAFTQARSFAGRACVQAIKSFVFGPRETMDLMDLVYSTSFANADTVWQVCKAVVERVILDVANAFALLHFAQQACVPSLEARARRLALSAFATALVADPAGFASLPSALLQELLEDVRLEVEEEFEVFKALTHWVQADAASRAAQFPQLLGAGVRLEQLTPDQLHKVDLHDLVAGDMKCVHMVVETVLDFHLTPDTRRRCMQQRQRPPPRLCQISSHSRRPTPTRTPLHPMAPTGPPLQGQAACSSACPLSAAASGSSCGLVTLAESPEEMALLGAPVLPPDDSPEHFLPMHQTAHAQPGVPHPLPAAACDHDRMQWGAGSLLAARADAGPPPMQRGSSAGEACQAGSASAATHPGYNLLQPTTQGLQQTSPRAPRVGARKHRALSPDAAGLQRLTLGRAQKRLRLDGSDLGLAWQPMSAAKAIAKPVAAAASAAPPPAADTRGATPTCSPTKVGLPQQVAASLKQIKKRRVSLRLRAQSQAAKPPKVPVSIPQGAPIHSSPLKDTPNHQAPLQSQPCLARTHSSSDRSTKSKVSDEMAQSPHARGANIRQSPACGLAQQHGVSGCLYSGLFDQGPHRVEDGESSQEGHAGLSVGCHALVKRPVPGQAVFRSQKRLRF
ncbi:hypothetical protein WJX74_007200 [Apatococcus lobatus]|uniref:Uncharacterized protein n=1 Tax=Apatococcus lobatus TaxID=904363 RepID=A0AAW1QYW7_9CHLO